MYRKWCDRSPIIAPSPGLAIHRRQLTIPSSSSSYSIGLYASSNRSAVMCRKKPNISLKRIPTSRYWRDGEIDRDMMCASGKFSNVNSLSANVWCSRLWTTGWVRDREYKSRAHWDCRITRELNSVFTYGFRIDRWRVLETTQLICRNALFRRSNRCGCMRG